MRISKEISGNAVRRDEPLRQGRGEFEWCDVGPNDPDSDDLAQRRIILALPNGVTIDTACVFGQQGGKQRVRTVDEAFITELTTLRDHLRDGLSQTPGEDGPSVSELAERIKALRASRVIESAPQRTAAKVSAEEPVTARIGRQLHATPDASPIAIHDERRHERSI